MNVAAILTPLKGFLSASATRDKACRLVQYTLRFVEHGVLPKLAGGRVELATKLRRLGEDVITALVSASSGKEVTPYFHSLVCAIPRQSVR